MSDRLNQPALSLYELYAEFAEHHEEAHDLIYYAVRQLLKHHHPATLLMVIQGAMQDELDAEQSPVNQQRLAPYAVLLAEMIERLYIEEQFYS